MGVNVSPDGPYVVIVGPGAVRGWCRVIKASCGVHGSFSVTVHSPIRVYSQHKSISNGENSVNIWPWGRPVAKPSVPSQSNLFPRCMADVFTHQAIENIAQPCSPFSPLEGWAPLPKWSSRRPRESAFEAGERTDGERHERETPAATLIDSILL